MTGVADECPHGLTRHFCDECNSRPTTRPVHPALLSTSTVDDLPDPPRCPARFDSNCPWCLNLIQEEFDWVFLRSDEWVCLMCAIAFDHGDKKSV